jgi:hypothetical protein
MKRSLAAALTSIAACVAESPEYLGRGFYDPVAGPDAAAVWVQTVTGEPRWSPVKCQISAEDATPTRWSWRFGRTDDCTDAALFSGMTPFARRSLSTLAIPVERSATLSFETRVSLPACGAGALIGGRVEVVAEGAAAQAVEFPEQLQAIGRGERWFAGEITSWTSIEHELELPPDTEAIAVRFGIVLPTDCLALDDPSTPCKPAPGADGCAEVNACCQDALTPGPDGVRPRYGGWQIDEIRLEVDDAP